jgi:tetratricopeptide (TPR) repeat protein
MNAERGVASPASFISLGFIFITSIILLFPAGLKAKVKKSGWIEVRSPHFTVVSNSDKSQAKMVALRLEMIQTAMSSVLMQSPTARPAPLTILAVAGEPSLKRLLPSYFKKRGHTNLAGLFTDTLIGPYIVLRTDVMDPGVFNPVFHEYTHFVMRQVIPGLPLWLVEGLADFYSGTRIQGHDILMGVPDADDLSEARSVLLIPIQELLAVNYSSPYYIKQDKALTFYAESWVLTHYLMVQDASHNTHRVSDYEQQVAGGGDPVATFTKIFGPTKHFDVLLDRYLQQFSFSVLRFPVTEKLSSKQYSVRPLSRAEVDSDQAEFLLARGHSAEAEKLLQKALVENPRSSQANALQGFWLLQKGNVSQAAGQANKAIQLDPNDYRGYFYAALAMQNDHLSAARAAQVEKNLKSAIALKPGLAVAESMLAELYLAQGEKLDQALAWAAAAVRAEPENNNFLTSLEILLLKQDREADAVAVEMRMLDRAHTPKEKAEVRNDIGWNLLQQNVDIVRADFEIKKANQLDPKDANIIDSLGHLLEKEDNLPQAEAAYRHALALEPKLVSSLEGLGDTLRKEHHLDQAIAEYQKTLAIVPNSARAHYSLALAYQAKGDATDAASELKAARNLNPYDSKYQQPAAHP